MCSAWCQNKCVGQSNYMMNLSVNCIHFFFILAFSVPPSSFLFLPSMSSLFLARCLSVWRLSLSCRVTPWDERPLIYPPTVLSIDLTCNRFIGQTLFPFPGGFAPFYVNLRTNKLNCRSLFFYLWAWKFCTAWIRRIKLRGYTKISGLMGEIRDEWMKTEWCRGGFSVSTSIWLNSRLSLYSGCLSGTL